MKKIFIAVMAMAAFAACSTEEQIAAPKGQEIAFGDAFVDNSVRAIDNTYGVGKDLTSFKVYGTATGNVGTAQIFNGTEVTGAVGDANWNYTGKQYWMENTDYQFVGIVDADIAEYDALFPTKLTVTNEKDALVSNIATRNQGTTIEDSAVALQFKHLLSKIKFTFIDTMDDKYTFKVTNIAIAGANVSGTYEIASKEWESLTEGTISFGNATNETDADVTDAQVVATSGGTTSHFAKLAVPGDYNLTITFDVELSFGGTKVSTKTESVTLNKALLANYSYNFTAELEPGKPIVFKVTSLEGWVEPNDVTVQ